jgi:hypothetical protein
VRIPNGHRASLGSKLEDYTLNPSHRHGQHKARVFESALGITLANRDILAARLLEAVAQSNAAEALGNNGHGETYALRFEMSTGKGRATVLSAWIIRRGEAFPRLTTCFIVPTS